MQLPRRFLIARNPDPESRLPYLVRLPLGDGLVLKVRDTWPRTARAFRARAGDEWPEDADVVEDLTVLSCVQRGIGVDLVLDRPRENRFHRPGRPGSRRLGGALGGWGDRRRRRAQGAVRSCRRPQQRDAGVRTGQVG